MDERAMNDYKIAFNKLKNRIDENHVLITINEIPSLLRALGRTHSETETKTLFNELEISGDGMGWILDMPTFMIIKLQEDKHYTRRTRNRRRKRKKIITKQWQYLLKHGSIITTEEMKFLSSSYEEKYKKSITKQNVNRKKSYVKKRRVSFEDEIHKKRIKERNAQTKNNSKSEAITSLNNDENIIRYRYKSFQESKTKCIRYPNCQTEYGIEFPINQCLYQTQSKPEQHHTHISINEQIQQMSSMKVKENQLERNYVENDDSIKDGTKEMKIKQKRFHKKMSCVIL